jgi:hypothetical protein
MSYHPFEYRAPDVARQDDAARGVRRGTSLPSLLRRIQAFSDWLDDSWLGVFLGAVIMGGFMIAIPVLLPIVFEVFFQ